MARKNPKEFTTIEIKKEVLKKLSDYKVHPNQSYGEVIKKIIENEKDK